MPKITRIEPKQSFDVFAKCEAFFTGGNVQFTKSGKNILAICGEELKSFNIESGKIENVTEEKQEEREEISTFLLADDDETLIVALKNGIMRHWHLPSKAIKRTWKSLHNGPVSCMAFDSTITLLATGGSDSSMKIWSIIEKYCTHNLKGAQGVFSKVSIQKIGSKYFAFGAANDYQIHIWDLDSSRHVTALEGHYSTVNDFLFVDNNNKMLSCGRDKVVLYWDMVTHKLLKTIPVYEMIESLMAVPDQLNLPNISFQNNNMHFITAGDKGILRVWNTQMASCIYTQEDSFVTLPEESSHVGPVITNATYIPALECFAVSTFEQDIILYSIQNFFLSKQFVGYNENIMSTRFMSAKDSHLAVATNSSHIKIYQLSDFSCQMLKGHADIVLALDVFSRYKHILVSGSKDNNVRLWILSSDCKTVEHVYTGFGHTHSVTAVACCKGKSKFFVTGSQDTTLKLWNAPEKVPLVALKLTLSAYVTTQAHDKIINSVDISTNDKLVASGSQDHTAKIWNVSDLSLVTTLRGHKKGVWCVNFSPVDMVLATSSGDETIRLWSLSDFSTLKILNGHEATVLQVLFLTRGSQLLSSGSDGNIKLWDIKDSLCIKTLSNHNEKVWTLTASSNENFVASGGDDSSIVIWKDVTKEEKEKALVQKEEFIAQEQSLFNLIRKENWPKALGLAISLEKPYQAHNIIDEILLEENGKEIMRKVFDSLRQDQIETLALKFAAEWITTQRSSDVGKIVIDYFHRTYDTEELLKIPNLSLYVRNSLPYLEKDFKRQSQRCQDMLILDFALHQITLKGYAGLVKETHDEEMERDIVDDIIHPQPGSKRTITLNGNLSKKSRLSRSSDVDSSSEDSESVTDR